ncbi:MULTISPECIES: hypothetical protein [Microbacterium]|uniref:hypothetical protein n=1 Tax=Microbacterium TaxID=33882 RepID=UPI0028EB8D85|nr:MULTISPECIES: hypothetical protein [Microbacterium]
MIETNRGAGPHRTTQPRPGRTTKALSVTALGIALALGTAAFATQTATAASAADTAPPPSTTTTSDTARLAPTVEATHDSWTISVSKSTNSVETTETLDGDPVVSGYAPLVDVAAGDVTSLGPWVAGSDFDFAGVGRLSAIGQAGADITAVSITTSTGRVVEAKLSNGIWLASWNGDLDAEAGGGTEPDSGRFAIAYVTKDGRQHTVSSVDVSTD